MCDDAYFAVPDQLVSRVTGDLSGVNEPYTYMLTIACQLKCFPWPDLIFIFPPWPDFTAEGRVESGES